MGPSFLHLVSAQSSNPAASNGSNTVKKKMMMSCCISDLRIRWLMPSSILNVYPSKATRLDDLLIISVRKSKYLFLIPILICILVVSSVVCILVIHFSRHSNTRCSPSSCGSIRNISSPFRLNTDPEDCGNPDYELTCEQNRTVLTLKTQKYYVQSINYDNYTVRVVDSGVQQNNMCSFPRYALAQYSFDERYPYGIATPVKMTPYGWQDSTLITVPIIFLRCPFPMKSSAFVETSKQCWNKSTDDSSWAGGYAYAKLGSLNASDLRISCRVELITMTSWRIQENNNVSYENVSGLLEIHDALMYGFELSWFRVVCQQHCGIRGCYLDLKNEISCGEKYGKNEK
nr:LEAF RUST 10 DISEASE-RESISTANCE LOCUS RECEPTOR-LIKE PROTEIN KINASE-like 2.1 [Ipomoea trifida]